MIDIFEGHFCRRLPEKDAATFDLRNKEQKDTFYAVLNVILHAARTAKLNQPKAKPEDISEDMAIAIYRVSNLSRYSEFLLITVK